MGKNGMSSNNTPPSKPVAKKRRRPLRDAPGAPEALSAEADGSVSSSGDKAASAVAQGAPPVRDRSTLLIQDKVQLAEAVRENTFRKLPSARPTAPTVVNVKVPKLGKATIAAAIAAASTPEGASHPTDSQPGLHGRRAGGRSGSQPNVRVSEAPKLAGQAAPNPNAYVRPSRPEARNSIPDGHTLSRSDSQPAPAPKQSRSSGWIAVAVAALVIPVIAWRSCARSHHPNSASAAAPLTNDESAANSAAPPPIAASSSTPAQPAEPAAAASSSAKPMDGRPAASSNPSTEAGATETAKTGTTKTGTTEPAPRDRP